jgi:D-galactarolactone cycloisomerase
MRISSIETYVLESLLERPFGWSQGWIDRRRAGIVKVTTDDGIVGWSEDSGRAACAVIHNLFAPLLLGQDPMNRVGLWERMLAALWNANLFGGLGGNAISGVDIALWDIAGQATGLPVSDLLGGRVRDRVAVYATGLYYTAGEFPDRLLEEARGYVEAGYRGMKTKVGGLPIDQDVRRVAAIREAIGPNVHLMVDANQAYDATSAIRVGERLAGCDILWFEEPVSAMDVDAYLAVKAALPMAIAGGECLRTRYEFREPIARRAFDIAQPDVSLVGGITELRTVATMANAFGIQVNPHVWGSPIMIAATLHVAATLPPCPPARSAQPYVQEPTMEFDRTPSAIRETLCGKPFDQLDGYIPVPSGPGLGIAIDEDALQRLCVRRDRSP